MLLLAMERFLNIGIFDPALGGDPVLFQHFFWFYSHPAVYIMILPAFGVISELMGTFSRQRVFGYRAIALSSVAIAMLGFMVWGHHMFVSGQSPLSSIVFSVITFLIGVPVRHQDLQLGRDDVQGLGLAGDADALRARLPLPLHHRRADGHHGRRDRAWTSTSTTPTSSSPTSTT